MPEYDAETQHWFAQRREMPYAHVSDDQGTLDFLSSIGALLDGRFEPRTSVSQSAFVKFKVINHVIRHSRKIKLRPVMKFGYCEWMKGSPCSEQQTPEFLFDTIKIKRRNPGTDHRLQETTCQFIVRRNGEETIETVISVEPRTAKTGLEPLQSRFYCSCETQNGKHPSHDPVVDVGIITVREDEFMAVLQRFQKRDHLTGGRRFYDVATVDSKDGPPVRVAICKSLRAGQSSARDTAEDLIRDLHPTWILLVGIAGGFPSADFSLGDLVVSDKLVDFSVWAAIDGKRPEFAAGGGRFNGDVEKLLSHLAAFGPELGAWNSANAVSYPRPALDIPDTIEHSNLYGDSEWRTKVRDSLLSSNKRTAQARFITAPTVSANVLVKDSELAKEWLNTSRDLGNVEMELAGVYDSVVHLKNELPRIIAIRGISDIIGYRRSNEWLNYACHSAASFASALIRSGIMRLSLSPR